MRIRLLPLIFALAGLGAGVSSTRGQDALAPPSDSPIYDDLDHFRALGLWRGNCALRPMTFGAIARAAREIRAHPGAGELGPGDRRRLLRLEGELRDREIEPSSRPGDRPDSVSAAASAMTPLVLWRFGFALRGVGMATGLDSIPDLERHPRRDWMFAFSPDVSIGRRFAIQSRFYEDFSRLSRAPRAGWVDHFPSGLEGSVSDPSARNDRAVIGLSWKWGDLRFGREDRRLGVGRHGTLFFSDNAFPLDGFSLNLRTGTVSMGSLVGQTSRSSNSADSSKVPRADAYVAAHRFEFHPPWPIRIGFYEAVAWGERGLDLAYVNPVGILVAFTQDIFDRYQSDDKKIVGGDLQVDLHPVSIYSEILLNRLMVLKQARAGNEAQITSLAQLVGFRWADPFSWSGADFDLEYAHLDPEVYFHKDRDPYRAFVSGGEVLGHWLGPNADDLYAALSSPGMERWGALRLSYEQSRWGVIRGMRGLNLGFAGLLKKDKRWITGDKQVERIAAVRWNREGWRTPAAGRFDSQITLAWVDRTGVGQAGTGSWKDHGVCLELRLTWRLDLAWRQDRVESGR